MAGSSLKSTRHERKRAPAPAEIVSNQEFLRQNLETIVKGITLSRVVMDASAEVGDHGIAEACRNWIGVMAHLVRETGLEEEYRQIATHLNEIDAARAND